jgi:hypothetical protein
MRWIIAVLAWPLAIAAQTGQAPKNASPTPTSKEAEHRAEDVARHRQMARAHEEAARCLESGQAERACQERLREMCKGIAVGQYCGMRHGH